MHREGVRWIGELVPYLMGTGPFASPGFETICATAEELRMPINLHLHPETLADLEGICPQFPNLPLFWRIPAISGRQSREWSSRQNGTMSIWISSGIGLFRWNMHVYLLLRFRETAFRFGFPDLQSRYESLRRSHGTPLPSELENIFSRNFPASDSRGRNHSFSLIPAWFSCATTALP